MADRLCGLVGLGAPSLVIALSLPPAGAADSPSWNGEYAITWDGSSWTQVSDFQWDVLMPNGTTQWNPARADVRYTPQPDGSLPGTMHTEISSGACQGTVDMNMTAEPA